MRIPRTVAAISLLGIGTLSVCAQERAGEITVLRSDERSLVFEYVPHHQAVMTQQEGAAEYSIFDFSESTPGWTSESVGNPDLRSRVIAIGMPARSGNAVQVVASDYEDIPNVTVAPIPFESYKDGMLVQRSYRMNPEVYGDGRFLPEQPVQLLSVEQSRDLLYGGVKVYPVQYNPVTHTVRKYSRLVVEVVFAAYRGNGVLRSDELAVNKAVLNSEISRRWMLPRGSFVEQVPTSSVLQTGPWYRIAIQEEGVYKLTASHLSSAGINLSNVDPRSIRIFGNGGREVPENIAAARPVDLVENAIYVEGESDGRFDGSDYVLFYARGVRGFQYNPATKRLDHYLNHYTETNYYWITFGGSTPGKRMSDQPSAPSGGGVAVPDRFRDAIAMEEEKVNFLSSGKDWYGQAIVPRSSFTYTNTLPGLVPNDQIYYRYVVAARAGSTPIFTVLEQGSGSTHSVVLGTVNFQFDYTYATAASGEFTGSSTLPENRSALNFGFNSPDVAATGWVDWFEVQFPRSFAALGNYLHFRGPDTTAIVEYRLEQFSSSPFILNVSRPDSVLRVTGIGGSATFRASESSGGVSEYVAAAEGGFKTPAGIQAVANQDLRGYSPADSVDFIIVTSREFRSAADRLKAYREQPAHGNLRTLVVEVDSIYNEFGGGLPDITAIRDYLKLCYDKWAPRLRFVLMLGGASYDYKGILSRSSFVPTWQSGESRNDVATIGSDDFFVKLSPSSDRPSLITGRISSRQLSEANVVVDKLISYEEQSATDSWKTRMLYIGDDSWTPEREDGTDHSQQAETLANLYTPDEFEKKKIFIAEYPTVNTAQGRRKPAAYDAIIDAFNRGMLVINFTGHGNPTVWTHESVFSTVTSIPLLTNANKLTVFFGATCNFSQFDDSKRLTGSELLLNKPDGGAIGAVSATRKVFSVSNAALHQGTFARMFERDAYGRLVVDRPAAALFKYKVAHGNDANDQKFFYMGDPTMRLQYPVGYAAIDSINAQPVDSVNGQPRTTAIQLRALSTVSVKGTIRDADNQINTSYIGRVLLTVNDATRTVTIVNFWDSVNWPYRATGSVVYRGELSVVNGKFAATFIVPKDIQYADSTTRGRMLAYVYGGATDGVGYTSKIYVGGTDTTAAEDTEGPDIRLYLGSRGFRAGDHVTETPKLIVDLQDDHGINTSGTGIGHRMEAWLNNSAQSIDITDFYTGQLDDYQRGSVEYLLKDLPSGRNTIRVRAWDTYNNASTSETFFEVTSGDQLRLADVMNYPNPFAGSTEFTFRTNQLLPLNVQVKIYTVAGRLIQTVDAYSPGETFVRIPWDGRDRDGDVLANGVYLYKVIAKTTDGRFTSESLGKLSVLK